MATNPTTKKPGTGAGTKAKQAAEAAAAAKAAPAPAPRELPPGLVVFVLSDQHIAGARVPAGALAQMPEQVADAYIKAGAADGNDAAVEAALAAGGAIIDLREALTPVTDEAESGEQNPAGA